MLLVLCALLLHMVFQTQAHTNRYTDDVISKCFEVSHCHMPYPGL